MLAEKNPARMAAGSSLPEGEAGGASKRSRESADAQLSLGGPNQSTEQASAAFGWGPPHKQARPQAPGLPTGAAAAGPFAALAAAASRVNSKLLPPLGGTVKNCQAAASAAAKGRAVLAIKAGNGSAAARAPSPTVEPSSSPLTPRGGSPSLKVARGAQETLTPTCAAKPQTTARKELPTEPQETLLEEPWRVSQRCRLVLSDLTCAYSRDDGQDNHHNSRTAQSGYCQEAYRADRAHPGDYLKGFKRLTPEARDLIVCILNKVAVQLAHQNGSQAEGKLQDSLDPRVAAVVGVAVQLFDRVMAMIHQGDVAYGFSAERKQHPLRGLAGRGGTSPLLLNQLIAIACFGFADRLEAIASTDYATIVDAWRHNAAGMLRSAWPSSLSFNEPLRNKLLLIERIIVAYIAPSGNIAVAPTSELVESLLNVGYLFATAHFRCAAKKAAAAAEDAGQAKALHARVEQQEAAERELLQAARSGQASLLEKQAQPLEANPFVEALLCRGAPPAVASSSALSLRVSGSSRVDIPRQVAQVFVRLALLDRNICLQFKPSTVAAAAAQLAMFHSGGASSFPPELQAALGAAAAAVAATGGTASFRLVRRCQFLMLHKWLSVKHILLQRNLSPASPSGASSADYLPDRLIAEWVQRRLVLPHHRRVILAVQQHANSLVRCQALARQQELEQEGAAAAAAAAAKGKAGGPNKPAEGSGSGAPSDVLQSLKQQQPFSLENAEPLQRQTLQVK
ncbi:hypothetical protein ACSSS7_000499 [Eimeria intestinalis]